METLPKISSEETISPTDSQLSAARANGFFRQLTIIDSLAKNYTDWQLATSGREGKKITEHEVKTKAADIFYCLYFDNTKNEKNGLEQFRKDYGIEAEGYERLFNAGRNLMDRAMEEEESKAASITISQKAEILIKETFFAINNTPEKRLKLMELAGNSSEEIRQYAQSLSLTVAFLLPMEISIILANLAGLVPYIGGLDDSHARTAVVMAYTANVIATLLNTTQNYRAMHTDKLAVSPNILVTLVYNLIKKQFPEKDILPDLSIFVLSILPILIPEILLSFGLFEGGHGTSAAVARNIIGAVNQLIQAIYVEKLRRKTMEQNKK